MPLECCKGIQKTYDSHHYSDVGASSLPELQHPKFHLLLLLPPLLFCLGFCYRHLGICKTRAFAHHETSATHRFGGHLWPRRIKNASILIKACVNSRPALYVFWARFKTQSFLFILAHFVVSYFCGLLCICQHLCGSLYVCVWTISIYIYIYMFKNLWRKNSNTNNTQPTNTTTHKT